ncbi:signal peptidase I [Arcanobacterium hippocoleae]
MADIEDGIEFADAPDQMPPSFPPAAAASSRKHKLPDSHHDDSAAADFDTDIQNRNAAEDNLNKLQENADYPQKSRLKAFLSNVFEFAAVVAVALLAAVLLKTYIIQPFEIPSSSMANTLVPGDRIVVNKLADTEEELNRGDIVVFVDPGNWLSDVKQPQLNGLQQILVRAGEAVGLLPQNAGTHLVKRLIGKPGDHIVCCTVAGNLTINGTEVEEPYLISGAIASEQKFDVTVPAGHLWMMGDNRPGSKDSRYHQASTGFGFVPIKNVEGRAWLRIYPFNRFGLLKSQSDVFSKVKTAEAIPAGG